MAIEKRIAKISAVSVGMGGYQDVMYGISWTLSGAGWGVGDFWGTWARDPDKHCKWTKKDQDKQFVEAFRRLLKVLKDAKRDKVAQLVGVPIEVEFDGNKLSSWRVLTEAV